jgi:hypothetical protein
MTPVWLVLVAVVVFVHLMVLALAKAASMGDEQIPPDWDEAFAKYLQDLER